MAKEMLPSQRLDEKELAKKRRPRKRTEVVKTNPIKADPTRTGTLRRKFETQVSKRFNKVRKAIVRLVFTDDVFGLRPTTQNPLVGNVAEFRFLSDPQKIIAFRAWLQGQMQQEILQTTIEELDDAWFQQFVEEGFQKGAGRAFDDTQAAQAATATSPEDVAFLAGTRQEFLRQAFGRPVAINKVKLLVSRVFTGLKGVTDAMAQRITQELADGLVQGDGAATIARRMSKSVGIGRNRAKTIARTEIIRAHAEGQLDSMEQMGVEEVGVAVEWATAEDARVCPRCRPLDGVVFKLDEAKGLLPRHPNCRCAHVPANVGESTKGQIRKKSAIEKAIRQSLKADIPKRSKRTIAQQRRVSVWPGAKRKVSKNRPKSII